MAEREKICLPVQEMQEMWIQSLGWEDPLEEEMSTQSIILAWRIPMTEEPNGLQSMGLQRVRHDWAHTPTVNMIVALMCSTLYVWLQKSYKMCILNEVYTHKKFKKPVWRSNICSVKPMHLCVWTFTENSISKSLEVIWGCRPWNLLP